MMASNSGIIKKPDFILTKFLISLIRFYQKTVGFILPDTCRFYPSCSNYTIDALSYFGIFKGSLMSLYRILRCNPFFPGGYDPVVSQEKDGKNG